MPETDFSISTPSENRDDDHPSAADVYLLIEVSDSTLVGDRTTKLELYAENGIVEYWIVNLSDDCVEVYIRPAAAELRYDSKVRLRPGPKRAVRHRGSGSGEHPRRFAASATVK